MKLTLKNLDEIKKNKVLKKNWIKVGMSSCGIAAGAKEVYEILQTEIQKNNLDIAISQCGCAGMCYAEPLVEVKMEGMPAVLYGLVDSDLAHKIIRKHILSRNFLNEHIYRIKVS